MSSRGSRELFFKGEIMDLDNDEMGMLKAQMLLHPDWNDKYCRKLYEQLLQKNPNNLSGRKRQFVIDMYHIEEYMAGLDG